MFRTVLAYIGIVLLMVSGTAHFVVENGFIANPGAPDLESGMVIPYNIKGKVVYISRKQNNEITAIYIGEMGGVAAVFVYGLLAKRRKPEV